MTDRKELSIFLKFLGIFLFVIGGVLFLLSFSARREVQKWFGLPALIGFMPCGVLLFACGLIFRTKRHILTIIGLLLISIGIVLFMWEAILLYGIMLTLYFGIKQMWLDIFSILLVASLALMITGAILSCIGSCKKRTKLPPEEVCAVRRDEPG